MSLLFPHRSHPSVQPPSAASRLAGIALFSGAALLLVGGGLALGTGRSSAPHPPDTCDVPAGVALTALSQRDQQLVTRRLLACHDLEAGRITHAQYGAMLARLDAAWTAPELPTFTETATTSSPATPAIVWATTLRGFSSQYTGTSWAANQVLGEPDVYPQGGDNEAAWASLDADDRPEWLEVGFDEPRRLSAVEVYETFNPGATSTVELVTTSGKRITIQAERYVPGRSGVARRVARTACTAEPVAYVRVHIDSQKVEGWNEIDAIGAVPCRP